MVLSLRKHHQWWDGNGVKSVYVDYKEKEDECEQEQNNMLKR
mgnify:CR=1 FL=1